MDIREILAALDEQDRILWSQWRTEMRRVYLNAHNQVLGINQWDYNDDAFMDLIDIKLAILFDRSGRFNTTKQLVDNSKKIEEKLVDDSIKIMQNSNSPHENLNKIDEMIKDAWDDTIKKTENNTHLPNNEWK